MDHACEACVVHLQLLDPKWPRQHRGLSLVTSSVSTVSKIKGQRRGSPSLSYLFRASTSSHQEDTRRPAFHGILSLVVPQRCRCYKAHAGWPKDPRAKRGVPIAEHRLDSAEALKTQSMLPARRAIRRSSSWVASTITVLCSAFQTPTLPRPLVGHSSPRHCSHPKADSTKSWLPQPLSLLGVLAVLDCSPRQSCHC